MRNIDSIYVVLKIAEVCNLGCKYCYFFFGDDDSYTRDPPYLKPATSEQIGHFIAEGVRDLKISSVNISLHGGEPLMLGKSRFLELCRILNHHISPHAALRLDVQTNGTLLDEEWIDLLSAYEVGIGVSLDGPRHVNDRQRIGKNGAGTYEDTVRGVELLRAAQKRGLISGFAVGCVIDPNANPKEIYEHFARELKLSHMAFRAPIMDWTSYDATRARAVGDFYDGLLASWLAENNPNVRVEFLSRVLGAMASDRGALAYSHALRHPLPTFSVRSNGDLCPDDALPPKDSRYRHTGFNIFSSTLRQFLTSDPWVALHEGISTTPDAECKRCKWQGICQGGPLEERYAGNLQFSSKTTYCESRKRIFTTLYEAVARSVGRDLLERRLARTIAE